MTDVTIVPEYLEEEKRIASEKRKIKELSGYGEEVWGEFYENGYSAQDIIDAIKEGKKDAFVGRGNQGLREKVKEINEQPELVATLIKERLEEKELEKVAPKTGFPGLDNLIKGFIPGHLYTLTGHTNIGKTALACNFANHVASQGKVVLYLALEPDNTVIDYLASIATKKRFDDVQPYDYKLIPPTIEYFKKDKVSTPEKLIEVLRKRDRYDLVIVDHVGYFITDTKNPYATQSNVIKMLAGIAKEKRCAVMIIAHMRKSQVNKKKTPTPTMDDISGSAAFKQDSTEVLIAIRTENESDEFRLTYSNEGFLLVNKTKSGPNGSIKISYHDGGATIVEKKEGAWKAQF